MRPLTLVYRENETLQFRVFRKISPVCVSFEIWDRIEGKLGELEIKTEFVLCNVSLSENKVKELYVKLYS